MKIKKEIKVKKKYGWKIGRIYFIRTVTMYWLGRLVAIDEHELILTEASWIADTGRFGEFARDQSTVSENEPVPGDIFIGRGSIIDAFEAGKIILEVR